MTLPPLGLDQVEAVDALVDVGVAFAAVVQVFRDGIEARGDLAELVVERSIYCIVTAESDSVGGPMSKYSDPLWQTNPLLAQVREAQKEVEHIRAALRELEQVATRFGATQSNFSDMLVQMGSMFPLARLDGWCKSLAESEIGLWAMTSKGQAGRALLQERKRFLDEQYMKWTIIMTGKGAVRIGTKVAGFIRSIM